MGAARPVRKTRPVHRLYELYPLASDLDFYTAMKHLLPLIGQGKQEWKCMPKIVDDPWILLISGSACIHIDIAIATPGGTWQIGSIVGNHYDQVAKAALRQDPISVRLIGGADAS